MNKVLSIILISLFSFTVISCSSSSDDGSKSTDNTTTTDDDTTTDNDSTTDDDNSTSTTALVWDQGSWDSHNWQ